MTLPVQWLIRAIIIAKAMNLIKARSNKELSNIELDRAICTLQVIEFWMAAKTQNAFYTETQWMKIGTK